MYIYAMVNLDNGIVCCFATESFPMSPEDFPDAIAVDAVDETWIGRKKYDFETQTWSDVLVSESTSQNSLQFTHIDSDGVKHWLDDYINDLAENAGCSVETATVSEVETYLGI